MELSSSDAVDAAEPASALQPEMGTLPASSTKPADTAGKAPCPTSGDVEESQADSQMQDDPRLCTGESTEPCPETTEKPADTAGTARPRFADPEGSDDTQMEEVPRASTGESTFSLPVSALESEAAMEYTTETAPPFASGNFLVFSGPTSRKPASTAGKAPTRLTTVSDWKDSLEGTSTDLAHVSMNVAKLIPRVGSGSTERRKVLNKALMSLAKAQDYLLSLFEEL